MPTHQKKHIYLNYHNLGDGLQIGINKVHPSIFNKHINVIEYFLLNNDDISISITFDDGYENVYHYAKNILDKSKISSAKVFIITDYIGKENNWDFSFMINKYNHLNNNQIKSLHAKGWEIGSHGLSHKSFLSMSMIELRKEIFDSKKILEDIIGEKIYSIAPPFSHINQQIYDTCVDAGYTSIYIQDKVEISLVEGSSLYIRNNIYSIDKNSNVMRKINSNKLEAKKEKFISSFNNLTVLFSKIFK